MTYEYLKNKELYLKSDGTYEYLAEKEFSLTDQPARDNLLSELRELYCIKRQKALSPQQRSKDDQAHYRYSGRQPAKSAIS